MAFSYTENHFAIGGKKTIHGRVQSGRSIVSTWQVLALREAVFSSQIRVYGTGYFETKVSKSKSTSFCFLESKRETEKRVVMWKRLYKSVKFICYCGQLWPYCRMNTKNAFHLIENWNSNRDCMRVAVKCYWSVEAVVRRIIQCIGQHICTMLKRLAVVYIKWAQQIEQCAIKFVHGHMTLHQNGAAEMQRLTHWSRMSSCCIYRRCCAVAVAFVVVVNNAASYVRSITQLLQLRNLLTHSCN